MKDFNMDEHIERLFNDHWVGDSVLSSLENMKAQLTKSLNDQMDGYWSGHTAYHIMVKGGFLFDAKSVNGVGKVLTPLGRHFAIEYSKELESK